MFVAWSVCSRTVLFSSAGTLISSDHGETWFVGATGILGDECAIAELPNGTIVLNARDYVNQSAQTVHRAIAWSDDGGRSFSPVYFPPTLPDPVVEGSMIWGEHTPAALGVGQSCTGQCRPHPPSPLFPK